MASKSQGTIRVGLGGWIYEPWRGTFYPDGLTQKQELAFASRKLSAIEINATYHKLQKPESFARWHDETPDDFIFALKGSRFITNRRELAGAGEAIERFFGSGMLELKDKLGPINWQLAPTKQLDLADIEAFLRLLPRTLDGRTIRHALEVRHESFRSPEFVALAREHGVAIVLAGDSEHPQIADFAAPLVYARLMGTSESQPLGYAEAELDRWAARAKRLAAGGTPSDLDPVLPSPAKLPARDVFLFVIGGHKVRNPAAALALIERLA